MSASTSAPDAVTRPGRVRLFGHPPRDARISLVERSRPWRVRRALLAGGAGLAIAPVAALVPPHAPWVVAVLGAAGWVARRRWREEATLLGVEADCPRCEEPLSLAGPAPLRRPHTLPCGGCGHEVSLAVER